MIEKRVGNWIQDNSRLEAPLYETTLIGRKGTHLGGIPEHANQNLTVPDCHADSSIAPTPRSIFPCLSGEMLGLDTIQWKQKSL